MKKALTAAGIATAVAAVTATAMLVIKMFRNRRYF